MNYDVMDDKIFEFIYVTAMRDATLQQSYPSKKAWLTDCRQFTSSSEELKAFVSDVIEGKIVDSRSFDDRFLDVSRNVCDDINKCSGKEGDGRFTFGNAQKLINILMKYFYLHSFGNEEEKIHFQFCHCPMDQQLLEKVWRNRSQLTEDTRKSLRKKMIFLSSWGKEDFLINNGQREFPDRYKAFQKAIKELAKEKSPLEYDYYAWGNTDS